MSFSSSFVRLLISSVDAIWISGGRESSTEVDTAVLFNACSKLVDMILVLVSCGNFIMANYQEERQPRKLKIQLVLGNTYDIDSTCSRTLKIQLVLGH